jgi:uncharacterized protein involved in exopolysaccharide biosynthesis
MSSKPKAKAAHFGWAEAPRVDFADCIAMLWAERVIVASVGGAILALGLLAALLAPRAYTARAELLVRLGEEYVYRPNANGAAGPAQEMQAVVNAEMRMIASGSVVRAAIGEVGLARLYPDVARSGQSDARKLATAERAFVQHLKIETAPQTPSIALSFEHANATIAAGALNALLGQYLKRRRDVLVGGEYEVFSAQTAGIGQRAVAASAALSAFLTENGIGDFESELAALAKRAGDIETQLLDAQTSKREAEARAAALRGQMESEPEQIELYSESDARRDLVAAQLERERLLSRYQEDALPVREVDRRIAQLQGFLSGGDPASVTRRGINPVRQDVTSQLYAMQAEARAQRGREAALTQQREEVRARLRKMQAIEPQFRQLQRERSVLEATAQTFASRAEDARSREEVLARSSNDISAVERATPPAQGKSWRWPIMLVSAALAIVLAAAAGLARAFLRGAFPTSASAARTLGAPVLAIVPAARP